nr:hypothetical protein CFP56_48620 [Quercus suber]
MKREGGSRESGLTRGGAHDGGYTFVLNRLTKGSDADVRNKRSVKVHLYAQSRISTLNIINGEGIYLEKLAELVANSLKYGVVVEHRKLRQPGLYRRRCKLRLRRYEAWRPLSDGEELWANEPWPFIENFPVVVS